MNALWGLITGYFEQFRAILWAASLVGVGLAVHHIDGLADKAAVADHTTTVIKALPEVIVQTQTITKVIHDAKDKCAGSAMPDAVLKQLR